jgi:hypothetical protein
MTTSQSTASSARLPISPSTRGCAAPLPRRGIWRQARLISISAAHMVARRATVREIHEGTSGALQLVGALPEWKTTAP